MHTPLRTERLQIAAVSNSKHIIDVALKFTGATGRQIVQESVNLLRSILGSTKVHPDRLTYALAGFIFHCKSPKPFGGPKMSPGFLQYNGTTAADTLEFIVTTAYGATWNTNNPKALKFLVKSFNRMMEMHFRGMKDEVDELMLKGMKKAGHIEWFKSSLIPLHLRHVDEDGVFSQSQGVSFKFPSHHSSPKLNGLKGDL
ncbi:hypothetical protein BDR26DRAFT_855991, partial [Obelidium mucronatum]